MTPPLTTIGYEASTLPRVIQGLQAFRVDLVLDVRALARSRKAGFSKTLLGASLAAAEIGYQHLPDLGTPKPGRQAARAGRTLEMHAMFNDHLRTEAAQAALDQAIALSRERRVCLICFEADLALLPSRDCLRPDDGAHRRRRHAPKSGAGFALGDIASNRIILFRRPRT
jgi:uncharacterized protein (DUF488 family)